MRYTVHARERMAQRSISPREARTAVRCGKWQGDGQGHLRCSWQDVVVVVEPRQRLVVTAWRRG